MAKDLYQYQNRLINDLRNRLVKSKSVVAAMATGGGKTVVFTALARASVMRGFTVLVVTESRKIFKQISEELDGLHIKAKQDKYANKDMKTTSFKENRVYIAMAQSLMRRASIIEEFAALGKRLLIIVDEAHIATGCKLLNDFPDSYKIGFTATPDAKHLHYYFDDLVVGAMPKELVNIGKLTKCRQYERKVVDLKQLKVKRGEYTEGSHMEAFTTKLVYEGLVQDLTTFKFKKCIVFVSSIAQCKDVVAKLRTAGIACSEVHSEVDELDDFYEGKTDIIVSVNMVTKGWDYPPVDLIVIYRKTKSLPLYLQMIGRGSRLSAGKKVFNVIDYGNNSAEHGLWDSDRDWVAIWDKNKGNDKVKIGIPPTKECPSCNVMIPAVAKVCQWCGYEYATEEVEQFVNTELIELTKIFDSIKGKDVGSLTPYELSVYGKITGNKQYCIRVARCRGFSYLKDFGSHMGYSEYWAYKVGVLSGGSFSSKVIR